MLKNESIQLQNSRDNVKNNTYASLSPPNRGGGSVKQSKGTRTSGGATVIPTQALIKKHIASIQMKRIWLNRNGAHHNTSNAKWTYLNTSRITNDLSFTTNNKADLAVSSVAAVKLN